MTEVLICPKDAIDAASVKELREAGVVVIQTNAPEKCRFIRAGQEISGSDMLWAALKALQAGGNYTGTETQRVAFTKLIFDMVDADYQRRHFRDTLQQHRRSKAKEKPE